MMGRPFGFSVMCLCLFPVVVRAWNDMLPPVQFLKPKQVGGLMNPPAPIFEIIKHPPDFGELEGPIIENLDQARVCCEAMTAQCIACAKGMRIEDVCRRVSHHLPGCSGLASPGIPAMAGTDMPSPPLKKIIKEAVMTAEGKSDAAQLKKDVVQFVNNHPGAVENAKNAALKGLSKMFSHSHRGQNVETKNQKLQTTSAPAEWVAEEDGSAEEPDFGRRWFENPWIIAGIATVTAAVCTGIAVGVLCFARIQRVQIAREPLLAGGPMQSSLTDATMEAEMAA